MDKLRRNRNPLPSVIRLTAVAWLLAMIATAASAFALVDARSPSTAYAHQVDAAILTDAFDAALAGGGTRQHAIVCVGESSYAAPGNGRVTYGTTTECSMAVPRIGASATLQMRLGIWPFYSWVDVGSAEFAEKLNDTRLDVATVIEDLSAGRYRIRSHQSFTMPPDYLPSSWDSTSYSIEFDVR